MPEEHGAAYNELRGRITELVRAAPAAALNAPAPATPAWRIRDVLAHLVGVANDVICGRIEGIASDAWTGAQVDARTATAPGELIEEWDEYGPQFAARLSAAPAEIAGQALLDAATHEHDMRHALDRPGARDTDAVAIGWTWMVGARTRAGGAPLRFVSEFEELVGGSGEPLATVEASRFELMRASTGRRTASEVEAYTWTPAPQADLILAGPIFALRTSPLGE